MSTEETDDAVALVLHLERELQTQGCRRDRVRLLELLAPDFVEVGASGRVYDRPSALELLDSEAAEDEIEVIGLNGRVVADGVILASWDSAHKDRRARRTSLWRHDKDRWRQVHHQGTILPG